MSTEERLSKIEEKIDKLSETLITLARVEEKISDLEIRRAESHERVNRLSASVDRIESQCSHMSAKLELSNKIIWGLSAMVIAAILTEVVPKIF